MERDRTMGETAQFDRRAAIKLAGVGFAATLAATSIASMAGAEEVRAVEQPAVAIPPLQTELCLEALVTIAPAVEVGPSSHGTRRYIPITGGTFHGPRIKGVVLPGGADWQLERPDGVLEINALYSIKTDDGAVIIVHNPGIVVGEDPISGPLRNSKLPKARTTGSINQYL